VSRTFSDTALVFIFVCLLTSGSLLAGCKKNHSNQPIPPAPAQPSVQSSKEARGQTAQPEVRPEVKLNRQGMEHVKSHDYDAAIKEFTEAIEKYPSSDVAYSNRASVFMQQKKFEKAFADLNKAKEINPKDPVVYYNLASLYSLQNQPGRGLDSLDRALELGFNDYAFLLNDPDLNNVRKHPKFKKILQKYNVIIAK